MTTIELIGVPFDGFGRPGNQTRAAAVLRAAGLEDALSGRTVVQGDPMVLPRPVSERAAGSGLLNEPALIAMTDTLHALVSASLNAQRLPLVYGADCSVLLGCMTALRDVSGEAGLVFVDGHEDTTPLDVSDDGEAANMELALLLGIAGRLAPEPVRKRLPAVKPEAVAMMGQRDHVWRRNLNVGTLADRGVWLRRHDQVAGNPGPLARDAVAHVRTSVTDWWLHVDLDVLARDELVAQGLPGVEDAEGGLTWGQLTEVVAAALRCSGCRGWSLAIYDPDQDEDGSDARRIVQFVSEVSRHLD